MRWPHALNRQADITAGTGGGGGDRLRGTLGSLIAFGIGGACVHGVRPTASYRTLELGGGAAAVGVVAASYAIVAVFLAIPVGRAMDRADPRRFFLGGASLMAVGALVSALSPVLIGLALGQVLVGTGWMITAVSFQTITANRRHSDRDRGFARLAVAGSAGQLLGPLAAGVLLDLGPDLLPGDLRATTASLLVTAVFAVVCLIVGARTIARADDVRSASGQASAERGALRTIVQREGVLRALVVGVTVMATIDLSIAYLPVLGEARGVSPGAVGGLLSLRAASGLASRLSLPKMLDRFGRRRLLQGSVLISGVALLGVAAGSSVWLLAPLLTIVGFGLGTGTPMTMAWLSMQTPRRDRATALALRMAGNRVGQVVLPVGFGGLAVLLGPGAIFVVMGVLLVASSTLLRRAPLA